MLETGERLQEWDPHSAFERLNMTGHRGNLAIHSFLDGTCCVKWSIIYDVTFQGICQSEGTLNSAPCQELKLP